MNKDDFEKEVLSSDICPKNFRDIYKEFVSYQKLAMNTLNEFHRVCEKNGVPYQLAYGSLLGAIRDNGQIPWDYDTDVFVPFEEKEHLINALKSDLDSNYYFYCPENNEKCRHVIMRLAPNGYRTEVLHVDVFYLVGSPGSAIEREKYVTSIKRLADSRYEKLVSISDGGLGYKKALKMLLAKVRLHNYSVKKMMMQYEVICKKYPAQSANICIEADSFADLYEFDGSTIWNTKLYETKAGTFRIPIEYDKILRLEYRDYNEIMPLEERLGEMMHNYKKLKRFEGK